MRAVVETHHGVEVADAYRQFEDLGDPAVQAWARGQANHAAAVLASLPGRDRLRTRVDALVADAPFTVGGVERLPDGRIAFLKQPADADVPQVCLRDRTGADRGLVDPATLPRPADGGHLAIAFFRVSPDGARLLYGFAASGTEEETLRVRDVATGRDLPVESTAWRRSTPGPPGCPTAARSPPAAGGCPSRTPRPPTSTVPRRPFCTGAMPTAPAATSSSSAKERRAGHRSSRGTSRR